jgi:hypothetical protein
MKRSISRSLFHFSKATHKYLGLLGLVYFLLMGVSGILLNHPALLRGVSLPLSWMPTDYHYRNWNRMALRDAVFSTRDPDTVYVAGKSGVWQSRDGGRSFNAMGEGFPDSAYDRDTRCLLLVASPAGDQLYAGTRRGLYRRDLARGGSQRVTADALADSQIMDLAATADAISLPCRSLPPSDRRSPGVLGITPQPETPGDHQPGHRPRLFGPMKKASP